MPRPVPDVVHIGSASRDLAPDDPRGWRLGGGVTYASLTTARLGLVTAALIGVDATAAAASELDVLRAAGVEVRLARLRESPVFDNRETPSGRVQIAILAGVPLAPRPVPRSWLAAPGWSLVPVADEIDEAWAEHIPDQAIVAVGWQGLLRTLVAGRRVERRAPRSSALLRRANLVGASALDVAPETRAADLTEFLGPGARLVVTDGDRGGTVIDLALGQGGPGARPAPRGTPYRAQPGVSVVDPTGAGDTFLAALLAVTLAPELLGDARSSADADVRFAAAAASLTVGAPGLDGIGDLAAVRAVLRSGTTNAG